MAKKGDLGKTYRINLDERLDAPITPFEPDEFSYVLRLQAHLGGQGGGNGLYNAFISMDVYAQDKLGRWVIDKIPGTGVAKWMGDPVYSVYQVAGADVWFNTRVKPEEQNLLAISINKPEYLMLSAAIHHSEELDKLTVPEDERLHFFFWELQSFLKASPRIGGGKDNFLLGE